MSELVVAAQYGDAQFVVRFPLREDGALGHQLAEVRAEVVEGFRGVWAEVGDLEDVDEEAPTGDDGAAT